jgi:hypothetical protein
MRSTRRSAKDGVTTKVVQPSTVIAALATGISHGNGKRAASASKQTQPQPLASTTTTSATDMMELDLDAQASRDIIGDNSDIVLHSIPLGGSGDKAVEAGYRMMTFSSEDLLTDDRDADALAAMNVDKGDDNDLIIFSHSNSDNNTNNTGSKKRKSPGRNGTDGSGNGNSNSKRATPTSEPSSVSSSALPARIHLDVSNAPWSLFTDPATQRPYFADITGEREELMRMYLKKKRRSVIKSKLLVDQVVGLFDPSVSTTGACEFTWLMFAK